MRLLLVRILLKRLWWGVNEVAGCHEINEDSKVFEKQNKILLMGNPNVGKSVFFSDMTGVHVVSSNYAGTTVTYTEGTVKLGDETYSLIDVPGTYSLEATSKQKQLQYVLLTAIHRLLYAC